MAALVDQCLELEALYLALRQRIDALMMEEARTGRFLPQTGDCLQLAAQLMRDHHRLSMMLGVASDGQGAGRRGLGGR